MTLIVPQTEDNLLALGHVLRCRSDRAGGLGAPLVDPEPREHSVRIHETNPDQMEDSADWTTKIVPLPSKRESHRMEP